VPTIAFFYGIAIRMYLNDHAPAHFHAIYGAHEATFSIETGDLLDGRVPRTAERLIREWHALHREELVANWRVARAGELPRRIGGLDAE
jgi:hypothetical protein